MASTTAISSQTAAANSALISVAAGSSIQVFTSGGLGPSEVVSVEQSPDDGSTWYPVLDPKWGGQFLRQGITRNMLTGPGDFRLAKSVTSVARAVYYDS